MPEQPDNPMTRRPDHPIALQNFTPIDRLFTSLFKKQCSYLRSCSGCHPDPYKIRKI